MLGQALTGISGTSVGKALNIEGMTNVLRIAPIIIAMTTLCIVLLSVQLIRIAMKWRNRRQEAVVHLHHNNGSHTG